jgi:hypothetical protein
LTRFPAAINAVMQMWSELLSEAQIPAEEMLKTDNQWSQSIVAQAEYPTDGTGQCDALGE